MEEICVATGSSNKLLSWRKQQQAVFECKTKLACFFLEPVWLAEPATGVRGAEGVSDLVMTETEATWPLWCPVCPVCV